MKQKSKLNQFVSFIIEIIVVVLLALAIRSYVFTPVIVNGESMEPTLHDKEVMILNKAEYHFSEIDRFDIVVFPYRDEYLIKRVIGLPGESLEYKENELYINGESITEEFIDKDTVTTYDFDLNILDTEVIPNGYILVLGDNRENSSDSRVKDIGFINMDDIMGTANFVLFPFSNIRNQR